MKDIKIGFIGGSGLYDIDGIDIVDEIQIDTAWGQPSDQITVVELNGTRAAFLPRHARGHKLLPHEINYRANIAALKIIGVEELVGISAVGSLKEKIKPLDFVIPDQIIDRTKARVSSFFGNGIAGHIPFADPFCSRLQKTIIQQMEKLDVDFHTKETLVCMEGPAFSTRAESNLYRSWGAGVINMSTIPEAKLAREAEMCYSVVCMSTDYDCWKEDEDDVTVEIVIERLTKNSKNAKKLIGLLIENLGGDRSCACKEASKFAMITSPDSIDIDYANKLKSILPDYF